MLSRRFQFNFISVIPLYCEFIFWIVANLFFKFIYALSSIEDEAAEKKQRDRETNESEQSDTKSQQL
jgi:flagellar biosynthesis component FlhA